MSNSTVELWRIIDGIDCENNQIAMWLSNLALIAGSIEDDAEHLSYFKKYADALHLTINGLCACQSNIQKGTDQGFEAVRAIKANKADAPQRPTMHPVGG